MATAHDMLQDALARTAAGHGPGLFGLVTAPRPIQARDRFRIVRITKVYVATVSLQLVDDGPPAWGDTGGTPVEAHDPMGSDTPFVRAAPTT